MSLNHLKNVTTLSVKTENCIGCGICADICPHSVLSMVEKKVSVTNKDLCMECGGCAKNCPANAISVRAGVGCAGEVLFSFFSGKKSATTSRNNMT